LRYPFDANFEIKRTPQTSILVRLLGLKLLNQARPSNRNLKSTLDNHLAKLL